ncbi:unnamed protein product [Mycena citricolor]|uniref:Uncharacterized protein n=1 Tax=Mycena citricolor TaxID=2018698 RepID=A0AAD2GVT2_9AGAR|nr:unnamed protein product [Mycena citricolor]
MSSSQSTDGTPFFDAVKTTLNALHLIHAARLGIIPRVTRRPNNDERRTMIDSGAGFVFSVEESGIKRWTGVCPTHASTAASELTTAADGLSLSPPRIVGNFLVYREIDEQSNSRGIHKKSHPNNEQLRSLAVNCSPLSHCRALPYFTTQSNGLGTYKHNRLIKKVRARSVRCLP